MTGLRAGKVVAVVAFTVVLLLARLSTGFRVDCVPLTVVVVVPTGFFAGAGLRLECVL